MFVVVQHQISNKDAFYGSAEEVVSGAPKDVKPLQFLPSSDRSKATCLWEAPSVDKVKSYLEPLSKDASANTYFAVDTEIAIGLPTATAPH